MCLLQETFIIEVENSVAGILTTQCAKVSTRDYHISLNFGPNNANSIDLESLKSHLKGHVGYASQKDPEMDEKYSNPNGEQIRARMTSLQ